jgi:hypothetical protein
MDNYEQGSVTAYLSHIDARDYAAQILVGDASQSVNDALLRVDNAPGRTKDHVPKGIRTDCVIPPHRITAARLHFDLYTMHLGRNLEDKIYSGK